eukprot:COSAG01_NODE_43_length_32320_cov_622.744763_1_plen_72_part_10
MCSLRPQPADRHRPRVVTSPVLDILDRAQQLLRQRAAVVGVSTVPALAAAAAACGGGSFTGKDDRLDRLAHH